MMSYPLVKDTLLDARNKPIPVLRSGPTACGYSLEGGVFGKTEDNNRRADVDGTEIKAKVGRLQGRQRQFTAVFSDQQYLVDRFGYYSPTSGKLCFTRSFRVGKKAFVTDRETKEKHEVDLKLNDDALRLTVDGSVHEVTREALEWQLAVKLPNLCIVRAERITHEGEPHFRYNDFVFYEDIYVERWMNALAEGKIAVEFRVRDKDYGTSYNINMKDLADIYSLVHRH